MKIFQPVQLKRNGKNVHADKLCCKVREHLLQFHQEQRKKDELFDVNLAQEEKEMKEIMERRLMKQKLLLEEYELTMKNDLIWNEFLEKMNRLLLKHGSKSEDFKEILSFYFNPKLSSSTTSSVSPAPVRIQLLSKFLLDLMTKENLSFPYSYLQEVLQEIHFLMNSCDKANEVVNHTGLKKILRNYEEMIVSIQEYEKRCLQILKEQEAFFRLEQQQQKRSISTTLSLERINQMKIMKQFIEQLLMDVKHHSFLNKDLILQLNNAMDEIQERIESETSQNKEHSNRQYLLRKFFPYLLNQKQAIQTYQQLKENGQTALRNISNSSRVQIILEQMKASLIQMERYVEGNQATVGLLIKEMILKVSSSILNLLQISSQLINTICVELFEVVFQKLALPLKKEVIAATALVIYGIFIELKNKNVQKQFTKVLHLAFSNHDILVPNFLFKSSNSPINDNLQINLVSFYAFLLLYSNDNNNETYLSLPSDGQRNVSSTMDQFLQGPLSVHEGFRYLLHAIHQLHYLFYNPSNSEARPELKNSSFESSISTYLLIFMKYSNSIYWLKYQERYAEFIKIFSTLLQKRKEPGSSPPSNELNLLFNFLLASEKPALPPYYNFQNSFVVQSLITVSKRQEFADQLAEIEKDKQSPFMQLVKKYELDRLRMIFNRLGSTAESHQLAFTSLLQKIILVSQLLPSTHPQNQDPNAPSEEEKSLLMKFVFHKIVFNIFKDCQEEFFNEMDEAQVLRLVRITCLLCKEIPEFIPIFQSFYYQLCPLLVPKLFPEGSGVDNEFRDRLQLALGFTRKLKKDSQTEYIFEDTDKWSQRMSKIISIYSLLCIQTEQIASFTVNDIWKYLVRLTNDCILLEKAIQSMEYILIVYEIVFKITSPILYPKFQVYWIQLLKMVQEKILIHFPDDHPKKLLVKEFIEKFIQSNGQESISLFVATKK